MSTYRKSNLAAYRTSLYHVVSERAFAEVVMMVVVVVVVVKEIGVVLMLMGLLLDVKGMVSGEV